MRYQYYFTAGARFPEPGHEMDAFLFVDKEALLREKAVYELSDGAEQAEQAERIAGSIASLKLRVSFNATMSPLLMIESDELLTREDVAAYVETTPWKELIQMVPRHETT